MSFIYDFADNVSISAAELNAIAAGIGENTVVSNNFANSINYAVNKLNAIRSDILNPGIISGMSCSCEKNIVSISAGIAVFKNGMRLEITETETFPVFEEKTTYVYLYASESYNCAMPIITSSEKDSDAYLPVAEIDKYGNVTDARCFSTSKIPLSSGSAVQSVNLDYATVSNRGNMTSTNRKTHIVNLKDKYFSYIIFDATISGTTESGKTHSLKLNGYYKRSTGLCYGIFDGDAYFGNDYIGNYDAYYGTYVKPVFENGTLTLYTDCIDNIGTFSISMEVI